MALTVSSDLSVSVTTDKNEMKLTEKEEALKRSIQKGDPKAVGISQVMLGFMIISYSVPLMSSEVTEVLSFGVPWWSGITFIIAGTITLIMEKRKSVILVFVCMVMTIAATFIAVTAAVIYIVDIANHPVAACQQNSNMCDAEHHSSQFSVEMKSMHLCLHIVQASVAAFFFFILYKERRNFTYVPVF